jgi:hypothetical protein
MDILSQYPFECSFGLILLVIFFLEALLVKKNKLWKIPALLIYCNAFFWYFLELKYSSQQYLDFSSEIIALTYLEVIIFLVFFRLLINPVSRALVPRDKKDTSATPSFIEIRPDKLLSFTFIIWFMLLIYGLKRMGWNISDALFPLGGRANYKFMFATGALNLTFLESVTAFANYLYTFICSLFGILLPLQRRGITRVFNLTLIIITWPYFALTGTRNLLVAVSLPMIFSYVLFSKSRFRKKVIVIVIFAILVNHACNIMLLNRNYGFYEYFGKQEVAGRDNLLVSKEDRAKEVNSMFEQGFNMAGELMWINYFLQSGSLKINYGSDYFDNLVNFIPRSFWPNKPKIGLYYAALRGFSDEKSNIGVNTTLSTGFVGEGVIAFGAFFGPIFSALLMALWAGFLSRLWYQRNNIMRFMLFLVALGSTPNLGRNFSILVLWPTIAGYLVIRLLEYKLKVNSKQKKAVVINNNSRIIKSSS